MDGLFTSENLMDHFHDALNHSPTALLFMSAGLDLFAGKRTNLRSTA